ncbi:MAG: hypothetical protein Q9165_000859 [Trypethelium subeluteriae]
MSPSPALQVLILRSARYNVSASGYTDDTDVPDSRSSYCAGVSTAPDDTTFQVTIYGGYSSDTPQAYNDVYVLSIPSFTWFNMTPLDQGLGDGVDSGRAFHQCLMGNDAQMVVLGGQTGPASASPSDGWSDDALQSIFAQRVPYTPLPLLQPAEAEGTTAAVGTTASNHTGATVGGVVGGLGGLAILGGIAYFFARRTRGRRRQYNNVEFTKTTAPDHQYQTTLHVAPQEMEGGSRPVEADAGNHLREAPGDSALYSKVFEMQGD